MAPKTMYCEGEQLRFPITEFTQENGGYIHNVPGSPHWAATGEPIENPETPTPVGKLSRPITEKKKRKSTKLSHRIPKPVSKARKYNR